uniref:Ly-6/neurotoxin-like protein 1 n=1 Tax=Ornithorhynchus anatinus TaxID=9258 RepID=F6XIX4_ORNAN
MRLLLTIFLGAAAGLQLAHALQCHVCSHPNNCMQPMRCPALVTHCMTTRTYQTPTRILVSKSCVPKCYPTVEDIYTKYATHVTCCQYDLCNGATPAQSSPVTLGLGVFASLLCTLLWAGQ